MLRKILSLCVLSCAFSPSAMRGQDAASKALSESTQRVVFDSAAFNATALPHWNNGYLVAHEVETFVGGTTNVRLYNRSGVQTHSAAIWFPDSQRVLLYSLSRRQREGPSYRAQQKR